MEQRSPDPDFCASLMIFTAFAIQMIVFIILLVISICGINEAKAASGSVDGSLGPSIWMTLDAFAALLISSISYCFQCICGPNSLSCS